MQINIGKGMNKLILRANKYGWEGILKEIHRKCFRCEFELFKYYHAQCFFFKFLLLLIINHLLRLRTGWLKIEDWMKMGQLFGRR